MSYFKTVSFWNKMNHSVQLFGTGSQVALVAAEASHIWNYIAAGATTIAMLFTIWMDDKNNDGIVDVFEKVITVKAPLDANVEITEEIKKTEP